MQVKIEGVKELDLKFSRFYNFLGQKHNQAMRETGEYGKQKFRGHIDQHKTQAGFGYKTTTDLKANYKEVKFKKWGKIYPILRASDKMYNDLQYTTSLKRGQLSMKKIILNWGFKTKRSARIALYHVKGIRRSISGGYRRVIRDPWFLSSHERGWITTLFKKRTIEALRMARLRKS